MKELKAEAASMVEEDANEESFLTRQRGGSCENTCVCPKLCTFWRTAGLCAAYICFQATLQHAHRGVRRAWARSSLQFRMA